MKKRDNQRTAVYRWERELAVRFPILCKPLSLDECQDLIDRIWTDYTYRPNPPRVSDGRGTRHASATRWKINLPKWARMPWVVLHETTHSLLSPDYNHGKTFATLYVELMVRYYGIKRKQIRRIGIYQRPRRVRFGPLSECMKPVRRKKKHWKK